MTFRMLKNTVLLFLLSLISCGQNESRKLEKADASTAIKVDSAIVVGAERMDYYLPKLEGKKIALVANQTSVVSKKRNFQSINPNKGNYKEYSIENYYTHLVDTLMSRGTNLVAVFAPEHGFRGEADAGELVKDGKDQKTGLPIYSLHGKNKKPSSEQLKEIDLVVFDIQDVGVRFYTYISTLHYVMEACAENNIPLLILDRPNPNGQYIDGPTMEKEHTSFLGMHTVPLVHGMTIGEYAQMINGEGWLPNQEKCELEVITSKHYHHQVEYHLPIRPSPNLPNDQAIKLYPSLGLLEGTNINAGRGTDYQFQRFGAPFLDSVHFNFSYIPKPNFGSKNPKHKGEKCFGRDLSKVEMPRTMTMKYIIEAYENATDKSKVFNSKNFTTHAGTEKLQQQIEKGLSEADIKSSWEQGLKEFRKIREKYLLYD